MLKKISLNTLKAVFFPNMTRPYAVTENIFIATHACININLLKPKILSSGKTSTIFMKNTIAVLEVLMIWHASS